jgi:hypothetical protein
MEIVTFQALKDKKVSIELFVLLMDYKSSFCILDTNSFQKVPMLSFYTLPFNFFLIVSFEQLFQF